jgi:hypothetical protein
LTKYLVRFKNTEIRNEFAQAVQKCVQEATRALFKTLKGTLNLQQPIAIPQYVTIIENETVVLTQEVKESDLVVESGTTTISHLGGVWLKVTKKVTDQAILFHIEMTSKTVHDLKWLDAPLNNCFKFEKTDSVYEFKLCFSTETAKMRYVVTLPKDGGPEMFSKFNEVLDTPFPHNPIFMEPKTEPEPEVKDTGRRSNDMIMETTSTSDLVMDKPQKYKLSRSKSSKSASDLLGVGPSSSSSSRGVGGWVAQRVAYFNELAKRGGISLSSTSSKDSNLRTTATTSTKLSASSSIATLNASLSEKKGGFKQKWRKSWSRLNLQSQKEGTSVIGDDNEEPVEEVYPIKNDVVVTTDASSFITSVTFDATETAASSQATSGINRSISTDSLNMKAALSTITLIGCESSESHQDDSAGETESHEKAIIGDLPLPHSSCEDTSSNLTDIQSEALKWPLPTMDNVVEYVKTRTWSNGSEETRPKLEMPIGSPEIFAEKWDMVPYTAQRILATTTHYDPVCFFFGDMRILLMANIFV